MQHKGTSYCRGGEATERFEVTNVPLHTWLAHRVPTQLQARRPIAPGSVSQKGADPAKPVLSLWVSRASGDTGAHLMRRGQLTTTHAPPFHQRGTTRQSVCTETQARPSTSRCSARRPRWARCAPAKELPQRQGCTRNR